jgi:hypothetical protein
MNELGQRQPLRDLEQIELLEPLPHVALIGSGAHREFGGRRAPVVGERTVEAEPAADVN